VTRKSGKNGGSHSDRAEQNQRSVGALYYPFIGDGEEAGETQTGNDNHHAEQQCDCIEVHRLIGILERQGTRCDHEAGAYQGDTSPIDTQAGYSAYCQRQITTDKDNGSCDCPTLRTRSIAGRKQTCR